MRKNYVLDTSVLVHDNNCLNVFKDNNVIIPIAVLEELDHLKTRSDSVGGNARMAIRKIEEYCSGDLSKGVDIGNGITLFIDVAHTKDDRFNAGNKDDSILACVASYEDGIIVSKDINMRVRAKAYNVNAQDYNNDKLDNISELYMGYREYNLDELGCEMDQAIVDIADTVFNDLNPNECCQVTCNGKKSIHVRMGNSLQPIHLPPEVWGIKSKNREQAFALQLLLDKNIPLVTLAGTSGTGKSIISIASALELVINQKVYSKVEIYKPIQSVGNDIGFLPGDLSEKLAPWMGSVYDSMEFLLGADFEKKLHQYKDRIKLEAISYIRGKSLNNTLVIVDEAQNLTRNEVKTIMTRVGFNSKIILLGDYSQIDKMYLDATNNGLTYVIDCFKNSDLAGHITLTKGERSPLATLSAKIL